MTERKDIVFRFKLVIALFRSYSKILICASTFALFVGIVIFNGVIRDFLPNILHPKDTFTMIHSVPTLAVGILIAWLCLFKFSGFYKRCVFILLGKYTLSEYDVLRKEKLITSDGYWSQGSWVSGQTILNIYTNVGLIEAYYWPSFDALVEGDTAYFLQTGKQIGSRIYIAIPKKWCAG